MSKGHTAFILIYWVKGFLSARRKGYIPSE